MRSWWALTMACAGSWACLSRCAEETPTPSVPQEQLRTAAVRARGAQLYRDNCVLCHGENADGRLHHDLLQGQRGQVQSG